MNYSRNGTTGVGGMVPFLHFSAGDYVWLNAWAPSSRGQIATACVGLFLMAVFERLVAAMRTMSDLHWHARALAIDAAGDARAGKRGAKLQSSPVVSPSSESADNNVELERRELSPAPSIPPRLPRRTLPPFVAEHDIPRGILFAFQMLIGYLLMLVIMTFHAAYLLSIVFGLGVGQALFGRVSCGGVGH